MMSQTTYIDYAAEMKRFYSLYND